MSGELLLEAAEDGPSRSRVNDQHSLALGVAHEAIDRIHEGGVRAGAAVEEVDALPGRLPGWTIAI
jgi:hypothetical protein